jgi:glycosyltransferase involved in cell wall biosynthesis
MSSPVLISICIPAYKRTEFLKRLLDSIALQAFRDFEVVVTDDSPDQPAVDHPNETVQALCETYRERFLLRYFRNEKPLGTPENWNEAIRRSEGQWIKIMHDDDWFADRDSLGQFAGAIADPAASFIFSAYRDVFLDENRSREMFVPAGRYKAFLKDKTVLFGRNIVGPPSVILYKREGEIFFDKTVKWVVDIEFYIRYLRDRSPVYIDKVLINVGMGSQQVTRDCFRQRPVEIPENFYLLNEVGVVHLRNILVYDAWWRLMRNLEIRSPDDISGSGYKGGIPRVILSMIGCQKRVPLSFLGIGVFSKTLMFFHYITHYNRITA